MKYDDAEEVLLETGDIRVFGYLAYDDNLTRHAKQIEEALWHLNLIQSCSKPYL